MSVAVRKTQAGPGIEVVDDGHDVQATPGDVVVDVEYAGVCGTDLHVDDWYPAYHFMRPHLPVTLGHEFCGRVLRIGADVHGVNPGDRVVVRPSVTCGTCEACATGRHDNCRQRLGIGLTRDGAFTRRVAVPARNCVPVPQGLAADVAALAEPFTIAWHAVDAALKAVRGKDSPRMMVLGPGTIGQAVALIARQRGAQVYVVGREDDARCGLLRALGFEHVADVARVNAEHDMAGWPPMDVIVEATGSPESIHTAMARLAAGGTVVVTGIHPRPLALDLTALVRNEWSIAGSFRPPEAIWPPVVAFLHAHQQALSKLITHRLPLAEAQQAFDLSRNRLGGKVMLCPAEGAA